MTNYFFDVLPTDLQHHIKKININNDIKNFRFDTQYMNLYVWFPSHPSGPPPTGNDYFSNIIKIHQPALVYKYVGDQRLESTPCRPHNYPENSPKHLNIDCIINPKCVGHIDKNNSYARGAINYSIKANNNRNITIPRHFIQTICNFTSLSLKNKKLILKSNGIKGYSNKSHQQLIKMYMNL
mgnify:FL=1